MIRAIAEDDVGNLWFGGQLVLFKYDGKRFERFDQQKPDTEEHQVAPGSVFIHYREPKKVIVSAAYFLGTGGWSSGDNTRLTFNVRRQSAGISIDSIFKDSHGHLWFNNQGFISRWDGKELLHFVTPKNWGEIKDYIRMDKSGQPTSFDMKSFYPGQVALEDTQGNLWFKGFEGAIGYNRKGFQMFTEEHSLGDDISVIFEDREGNLWFGHDSGVTKFGPKWGRLQNFTMKDALGSNRIGVVFEDKGGSIWFSVLGRWVAPGGVARYDGEKLQCFSNKQMGNPLRHSDVTHILDDGKGGVWFIFGDWSPTHASRYSGGRFRLYRFPGTAPWNSRLKPTIDSEGNLWLGASISGEPIRYDEKEVQRLTEQGWKDFQLKDVPKNDSSEITAVHEDQRGNLWFAISDKSIKRYDGKSFKTFTMTDIFGKDSLYLSRIFEDSQGNLWFDGCYALSKYDGESFLHFDAGGGQDAGWRNHNAIHQDIHGVIWFIYIKPPWPTRPWCRIWRYDGRNLEEIKADELLGDNVLRASTTDRAGNLWLATSNGAIKYDGKESTTYTTKDGFLVNDIRDVREDSQGNIWFATWGGNLSNEETLGLEDEYRNLHIEYIDTCSINGCD